MAENRYIGKYPVIGIRPVIDARRGYLNVRGSLEEQTMNMASSAKKLFEENLRYSNGEPVKVVISPTTMDAWQKRQNVRTFLNRKALPLL